MTGNWCVTTLLRCSTVWYSRSQNTPASSPWPQVCIFPTLHGNRSLDWSHYLCICTSSNQMVTISIVRMKRSKDDKLAPRKSQLFTDNCSIIQVPSNITYSTPCIVVVYFNTSSVDSISTNKTDLDYLNLVIIKLI